MWPQRLPGNLFFVLSFSPGPGAGGLEGKSAGRFSRIGSQREEGTVSPLGQPGCAPILDGSPSPGIAIESWGRAVRWTGSGDFVGRPGGGISGHTQQRARGRSVILSSSGAGSAEPGRCLDRGCHRGVVRSLTSGFRVERLIQTIRIERVFVHDEPVNPDN